MKILSFSRRFGAGLAVAILSLGAASAGTISTPMIFLGGGNQLICIASNVSSTATTVIVRIIGTTGVSAQTCALPAGDNDGCQAFRNNDAGRCTITVNNLEQSEVRARIRGVLFSRRITAPFTMEGTVQAE
jgi:hypothetical protein